MGEFLDQPAKLSPKLRERKGNAGITPDNYQILSPSSNHIYTLVNVFLSRVYSICGVRISAELRDGITYFSREEKDAIQGKPGRIPSCFEA
jgi:hypothetical protein